MREYYGGDVGLIREMPARPREEEQRLPAAGPGQEMGDRPAASLRIVFYEVPSALTVRLPPPPDRHRYVRVAADILLIAAGTGLVVAAIEVWDASEASAHAVQAFSSSGKIGRRTRW